MVYLCYRSVLKQVLVILQRFESYENSVYFGNTALFPQNNCCYISDQSVTVFSKYAVQHDLTDPTKCETYRNTAQKLSLFPQTRLNLVTTGGYHIHLGYCVSFVRCLEILILFQSFFGRTSGWGKFWKMPLISAGTEYPGQK